MKGNSSSKRKRAEKEMIGKSMEIATTNAGVVLIFTGKVTGKGPDLARAEHPFKRSVLSQVLFA